MNLFWATRALTSAREEHLTAFVAGALNADAAFRRAYAETLLGPLTGTGPLPTIVGAATEVVYPARHSRVDMVLDLDDDRRVAVEHKLDAAETPYVTADGETLGQLRRYLDLPVDHVAYMRSGPAQVSRDVRDHPKYLRPLHGGEHYLWRDIYPALAAGQHDVTRWLREAFERLGYTPALPHVGDLVPVDDPQVRANRENFAKLWQASRTHLADTWTITAGRSCELYLRPLADSHIRYIYLTPSAQGGQGLLVRFQVDEQRADSVKYALEAVATPAVTRVVRGRAGNGAAVVDALAPLHRVLPATEDPASQQQRLAAHVVPLVRAAEHAVEDADGQPAV